MIAIASLLLIITLSLLVTRVATTALTLTGLSRQAARFQARSALTGVGFTTGEAESVVSHPVRRKIIMTLMLMGSAGIVTTIAALSVSFAGSGNAGDTLERLGLLIGGVVILLLLARNNRVDRWLQVAIRRVLRRYTHLDVRDYAALLHVHGDYSVSELEVEPDDWLAGHTLAELSLSDEGVLVLGVQRDAETYIGAPRGDTAVHAHDVLVIYGPTDRIADLDERPAGPRGDQARRQAVEAQRREEAEAARRDQSPSPAGMPQQRGAGT